MKACSEPCRRVLTLLVLLLGLAVAPIGAFAQQPAETPPPPTATTAPAAAPTAAAPAP